MVTSNVANAECRLSIIDCRMRSRFNRTVIRSTVGCIRVLNTMSPSFWCNTEYYQKSIRGLEIIFEYSFVQFLPHSHGTGQYGTVRRVIALSVRYSNRSAGTSTK